MLRSVMGSYQNHVAGPDLISDLSDLSLMSDLSDFSLEPDPGIPMRLDMIDNLGEGGSTRLRPRNIQPHVALTTDMEQILSTKQSCGKGRLSLTPAVHTSAP